MTPETMPTSSEPQRAGKAFPRYCDACRKKAVWPATLPYRSQVRHDGVLHTVETPELLVPRCQECGTLYFDNHAEEQISRAVRALLHLLVPEQIRANRLALSLSVPQLATRLGLSPDQLANWEDGLQFQARAHDNLLRAFFALPEVRSALCADGTNPAFGSVVGAIGQQS